MEDKKIMDMLEILTAGGRLNPEKSRAHEKRYYDDPSKSVRFDREKGGRMDQIKEMLRLWASFYHDGLGTGYPKQSPFVTERVQGLNRDTETYVAIPAEIVRLNDYIEKSLAPSFKLIIKMEYMDRRSQKIKAAVLGIPRQVFSQRLLWCHEQLNFAMFGR